MSDLAPLARFDGLIASGLQDVTDDPAALDSSGFWAVCADFEGRTVCARFSDVRKEAVPPPVPGAWRGPATGDWDSSLDRDAYTAGVRRIREHIAAGDVYQANLCRVLSAPLPDGGAGADVDALTSLLARGNPAPYAGTIRLPGHGVEVATASPELFLRRDGRIVESGPIKGTGRTENDLLAKDHAENVMIVDLVRNDLGRVCATGSVSVPDLCVVEKHPGLVHLVSTVRGRLADGAGWPELFTAAFPPGSVTGAPKSSALRIIAELERAPRGPYCGAVGWVDADRGTASLAVGIRTFWIDRTGPAPLLRFGTGAGITWGSDPEREWDETELKASRLLAVASGAHPETGRTAL
ncbi:chorismate-binding protein [Streptomyces anulatus]|uniref:chorismate-binding protein n=1 Tax=Streptomyces TaxID=1883 RepID=UPI00093F04A4|nr:MULTISPECIES: chorismate-binding protein [unclassified Streptomyces]OKJ03112.1 chloride transporter [Streptomyces sp. TSRI0261]QNQ37600.1 chorismate-binding protein [Streptomyces sp. CB00271]